ncbi:dynein regulatory complex subunit 5-like [Paramuricea clavata]|uniref:Dynein regulatory complex subunit 5-like n=1 Tax=Paramuricea clavata TaxID=317549 RepID=A0A7D9H888_PARCT|nr:dynein regulatory complex subunit 5-like [Paramuricea clavata]
MTTEGPVSTVAPPIVDQKVNPASDPRQMRRIIAEDPDWSLATVPLLTDLCIKNIITCFDENPTLNELLPKHKTKVLELLSTTIPLKVTAPLVEDEGYWQKCCKAKWNICDISKHGNNWKRMFFEKTVEGIIESYIPETTEFTELNDTLALGERFIRSLNINQLLPPVKEINLKEDDSSDTGSDAGQEGPLLDHFDFGELVSRTSCLQELHITYGVSTCGMNFEWNMFQFTSRDCQLLSKAVKACHTLKVFHLHRSRVDDDKARVLISHLLDHPSLTTLDFSHNKIGDSGARAIGKLMNGRCQLAHINLLDNKIKSHGGRAIAHALGKNTTLRTMNMRLNRLGDDGGQAMCKALAKNTTLVELNLGSNDLGEPTAAALAQVLVSNKTLRSLIISCNKMGEDGGKSLQEGMEENETVKIMDLRLTEVGQENEYCINQLLKRNNEQDKTAV